MRCLYQYPVPTKAWETLQKRAWENHGSWSVGWGVLSNVIFWARNDLKHMNSLELWFQDFHKIRTVNDAGRVLRSLPLAEVLLEVDAYEERKNHFDSK